MDSAWAAQPEPSSGPSRTPPAGSRPRHRHRSGSTTPPPHHPTAAHPPSTATPARSARSGADRSGRKGRGFRARGRPPRRRRRCRGRVSILVGASGEKVSDCAVPPARGPDPAPSLRPRCQRCGLQSFQPNEPPCCGLRPEGQLRAGPIPASHRLLLGNVQPDLPPEGRTPLHAASRPKEATGKAHLLPQGRTPPPLRPPAGSDHPAGLPPEGPTPLLHAASNRKGRTRRHPSGSDRGHPSTAFMAGPLHRVSPHR